MKFIIIIIFFLAISNMFCIKNQSEHENQFRLHNENQGQFNKNEPFCVDNHLNKWNYKNKFEILLPTGYYFSSSVIYNSDSSKIAEVSASYELLKTKLTGKLFIEKFKTGGEIETEYNQYSFNNSEENGEEKLNILKADSVGYDEIKWYYVIFTMEFEGPDEYGCWNAFDFCNIYNNRYTGITFYNRDLKNFDLEEYLKILKTIRFIDHN